MKRFEHFRSRRRDLYERLFSAPALCIAGLLVMPALLLNTNPFSRVIQFLGFWFLCWLAGKKNNPLMTILVIFGIVVFNLIIPYGRVIFSFGVFRVSSGALITGIQRAATLEGLIMLSRLSIRADLKIPGGFGDLVAESFRYFALIMESKQRITRKNFMQDIDQLMIDLSQEKTGVPAGTSEPLNSRNRFSPESRMPGLLILTILVILFWLPLLFTFICTP